MKTSWVDEVIAPLDDFIAKETDNLPFASEKGVVSVELSKENFHELSVFPSSKVLAAIDGGNANIIEAANFSVDFIRIVGVKYKGNKRSEVVKREFFVFVKAENKEGKIKYSVNSIGDDLFEDKLSFDDELETLDGEKYKIELASVAGYVRRYAELKLASELSNGETLVIVDGSIQAKTDEELKLIRGIKGNIGFLSKTCRLLTKSAASLNSALNELGPKSSWYYYPVFKISNANYLGEMYFVKLNSRSDYVFKLELGKETKADDFILGLSMNSTDPVFYGYPYALVEADKLARVTNNEKEYLKTLFLSKVKNKDRLKYLLSNLNAHDILDKINY